MESDTLLLNADFSPLAVVPWQKAVVLLLEQKVNLIADYPERTVHSQHLDLPWPAVVALRDYAPRAEHVPFNRAHVLTRDLATCQYCGKQPKTRVGKIDWQALTMDHVVPRSRAREGRVVLPWSGRSVPVSSWENVVTACVSCNRRKGARTPEEAGLHLINLPVRPSSREAIVAGLLRMRIPEQWLDFLPGRVRELRRMTMAGAAVMPMA